MKKFLFAISFVFTCFLVSGPIAGAEEVNQVGSPDDFREFLKSKIEDQGNSISKLEANPAVETLEKFNALSAEEQARFAELVYDPQVTMNVFNKLAEADPKDGGDWTGTLENGDIKLELSSTSSQNFSTLSTGLITASHTVTSSYLGIDVVQVRGFIRYNTRVISSGCCEITEVTDHGGDVVRNWYPILDINKNESEPWITGPYDNVVRGEIRWTIDFVHNSLGLRGGTWLHEFFGTGPGSSGGSVEVL